MEQGPSGARRSEITTLGDFLEENQRVITVLGVFTALTVFANNLRPAEFGQFLSFIFLAIALLIWFELWARFPAKASNWRLNWFENLLSLVVMVLVGYWIVAVHQWVHDLITMLVWGFSLAGISHFARKHDLFNRVFRTVPDGRRRLRYGIGLLLQVLVLALSLAVAGILGPPIDRFVDRASTELLQGRNGGGA